MELIPVVLRQHFSIIVYLTLSYRNTDDMGNVFYFYSMNTSIDKKNLSGVLPYSRGNCRRMESFYECNIRRNQAEVFDMSTGISSSRTGVT
jgi:hypothetical protein